MCSYPPVPVFDVDGDAYGWAEFKADVKRGRERLTEFNEQAQTGRQAQASTCRRCGRTLVLLPNSKTCLLCGMPNGAWRRSRAIRPRRAKAIAREAQLASGEPWTVTVGVAHPVAPGTWRAAEQHACRWMCANGYPDASLTRAGADGGVDVTSSGGVAQVKFQSAPVGIAALQQHYGLAAASGKRALFFSDSGYTKAALEFGRRHGVLMYSLSPVRRV